MSNKFGKEIVFYGKSSVLKVNCRKDNTEQILVFLEIAGALSSDNKTDNRKYDWDNSVTVKIGQEDLTKIFELYLNNTKKVSIFHDTGNLNKTIQLNHGTSMNRANPAPVVNIRIGVQDNTSKEMVKTLNRQLSMGQFHMFVRFLEYGFFGLLV